MALNETHAEDSRYALLSELALSLSKATDMKALTGDVIPKLKYLIDFNRCTLALLNDDRKTYRLRTLMESRQKMSRTNRNRVRLQNGISGRVMRSKEIYVWGGEGRKLVTERPVVDEAMEGGSLNGIICLPLQVSGKAFGALTLGTVLPSGYNRADISMASLVANHLSLAMDRWTVIGKLRSANVEIRKLNSELERRVQERTDELAKTNVRLSDEVAVRRKTEAALRESELKYRAIFTEARDGIVLANSEGQIVECNPEFERQTGRKAAELTRMKVWQLRPSNKVAQAKSVFQTIAKKGVGQSEAELEKPSRDLVHVDLRAKSFRIDKNQYVLGIVRDISERKRHEEELRKKSEIFMNAHWGMAISTADGILEQVNPAFARMHGYSVAELIGRPVEEVYAPEVRCELPDRLQTIEQQGHLVWETEHVRKDGTTFPVLMNIYAALDGQGDLSYRVANVIDISERKRAEEALRESEKRHRSLYTKTPIMLHSIDTSGKMVSVSDFWLQNLGYKQSEVIGHTVLEFLSEASRLSVEKVFLPEFFETGLLKDVALQFVKKSGGVIDVLLSAIAERDGQGRFVRSMAVLVDVTERKRAEEKLAKLRRQSDLILRSAGEGIYGLDRNGNTTFVNPAGARMLGWLPEELHGKPQHAVIHHTKPDGKQYPREECPIYAALKDGKIHRADNEVFWRKDGTSFPVEYTSTPILDEQDGLRGAVVTFRDVTKRKQAEEALQKAHDQLEVRVEERTVALAKANQRLVSKNAELQKRTAEVEAVNQELETFGYTVSHDLRSPLLTIHGFSQILAEDFRTELSETGNRYIELIQTNSTRMAQIIEDLLELSKLTRGEISYANVNLSELATSIVANLLALEPERKVDFVVEEDLIVQGDSRLLKLALENMLGNAWKFTSKHPTAKIELGQMDSKGKKVFYVRDDGAGFDSESTVKLFGPFQRLHSENEFEGMGVGLATVQRIIQRHGGRVWAEGEVEKGATFFFTFQD